MKEDILKIKLIQIKENNYEINFDDLYYSLALDMLKHIGTTDAILRDDLIYNIFAKWISQNRFSNQQLQTFLEICTDNDHLMKCVGNENDDTVFTRTFSALVIALIIYSHNQKSFLPDNMIFQTKDSITEYYTKEIDLRGYIGNKGWAHSVAHGADVIDELAQCKTLSKKDLQELLVILKLKICQGEYVYIDGEPDRISIAVRSIFMRGHIDRDTILEWLESFKNYNSRENWSIELYHQKINSTNFLKSLYFTLKGSIEDVIVFDKIQYLISNL
ncbi:DUF2785 domain-containing protein [Romboutsia sp.]|uniref:DUF2785 domain-containing protein n=1 Tax=Romboutsia sp. TaxID=1965302 RepID=UPI003F3C0474